MTNLTGTQLEALRAYAREHGRCWKEQLRLDWQGRGKEGPTLRNLRNSHGPSWLVKFRFPTPVQFYYDGDRA